MGEQDNCPTDTDHDPYNDPDRFKWLISEFDKKIDRFREGRKSLNQKATWTLATGTGLAVVSGLTRGPLIVASMEQGATNHKTLLIIVSVIFMLIFLALLSEVLGVYRPQNVEYPVSIFNFDVTGPLDRRAIESGDFVERTWEDILQRYIEPEESVIYHNQIRNYIDVLAETHLLHEEMAHRLSNAYKLLQTLAVLTFLLFVLA